jgi:hypothetical protein
LSRTEWKNRTNKRLDDLESRQNEILLRLLTGGFIVVGGLLAIIAALAK